MVSPSVLHIDLWNETPGNRLIPLVLARLENY